MKVMKVREILVTSALPYANGDIHLGHLLEHVQTDIWVRSMKAQGHQVTYVCGDDAHGTAIMLKAEANGVTPGMTVGQWRAGITSKLGASASAPILASST